MRTAAGEFLLLSSLHMSLVTQQMAGLCFLGFFFLKSLFYVIYIINVERFNVQL